MCATAFLFSYFHLPAYVMQHLWDTSHKKSSPVPALYHGLIRRTVKITSSSCTAKGQFQHLERVVIWSSRGQACHLGLILYDPLVNCKGMDSIRSSSEGINVEVRCHVVMDFSLTQTRGVECRLCGPQSGQAWFRRSCSESVVLKRDTVCVCVDKQDSPHSTINHYATQESPGIQSLAAFISFTDKLHRAR